MKKSVGMLPKSIISHHDNAANHTSTVAKAAIDKTSFDLLEHPPYSTDLAPSDYSLFPKLSETFFSSLM